MFRAALLTTTLIALASAHTAAWAKGMYCRGGNNSAIDQENTNLPVSPAFNEAKEEWWFQHKRGCDQAPPPAGEFLELPANGQFTVELAHNRAFTTLSYGGKLTTAWPDGENHPDDWNSWEGTMSSPCLKTIGGDGPLHTYNESSAAGTAWAISYESDLKRVTMENLVVFSVLKHTPWKRLATYMVPNLPKCPAGGCTCAWLWVPNGCGQANMYMQGFKCIVAGATSAARLAKAKPPVYCADDASRCVKGAKQMIAWNQNSTTGGNNIVTPPVWGTTPGYNSKCGFADGPQRDIFE